MHQNTPNYDSNIHFGPPWLPGGAMGGQNLNLALGGGFLLGRRVLLCRGAGRTTIPFLLFPITSLFNLQRALHFPANIPFLIFTTMP